MGARKCHCWDCVSIREDLRDSKGYHVEDEFETPYRKKGKGKKKCKRSKNGEHDFSAKRERMVWSYWTEYPRDENGSYLRDEDGKIKSVQKRGYRPKNVIICAKCSKPQSYMWRFQGW